MSQKTRSPRCDRREFIAGAAATAAFTIVKPSLVRGSEANSTIELGLIGCGGRGNWIVPFFHNAPGCKYRFVACADYYPEQVARTGEQFKIDASRRYTTLSGYKKMIESKLDAVVVQSPPYFHPEQCAAAVEAGKHVYLAKPIAVDVPGCQTIAESGARATARKLAFLVDFQTRTNPFYKEVVRRVHERELGRLVCGDARYPCGVMDKKPPKNKEYRLLEWYNYKALSGDFIVEQSIHAIDVATWFANANPIGACGKGGSKGLRLYGDCWDHFNVVYEFPSDFIVSFYSAQMVHGAPNEIVCRVFCAQGTVETDYFSGVSIAGPKPWAGGKFGDMYDAGAAANIKHFYECITQGHYKNETVAPSVRSNLTAILGRTACYKGGPVTWDEMMKAGEKLETDLSDLKS